MTLCVYALTRPHPLRGARGIEGERLRLVTVGGVAAITGELARAPRPTVSAMRRYDETIRRLHRLRPALLPARFGTCFDSLDDLVYVLRARRAVWSSALTHVRNRAQMTLRVVAGVLPADAELPDRRAARGKEGTAYLRARAAGAARLREIPGAEAVRDAVARWVRGEHVERRAGVTSVYHLVPRGSAGAYRRAAERAAMDSGLRMVVSGPWPPYAFAAAMPTAP